MKSYEEMNLNLGIMGNLLNVPLNHLQFKTRMIEAIANFYIHHHEAQYPKQE